MRKMVSVALGVALLGLATGCGNGDDAADDAPTSSATTTSVPTASAPASAPSAPASTPAGPVTGAQYQAQLAEADRRIAAEVRGLTGANSATNLQNAILSLSERLTTEATMLGALQVQPHVAAAHKTLQTRLRAAATALSAHDTVGTDAKCGGVVYTSQTVQRKLTADLTAAVTPLAKLGLRFGTSLPKVEPEPADQRPSNGDVLVRSGPRGSGRLQVKNGTAQDVAVAVVTDGKPPAKPHLLVYVQAKKTATISRIGGQYHLYAKSGTDWNPKRRQFSKDCSFLKFDQGFGRNEGWRVDLQPSALGNASTSDVAPF
ncbi:hypothetical protein Kfla_6533 [Kribbella flavida DSM 17836]|uniref:Lipoprotein n=1 Tax=Kribbella flavida (strain DSM 17836 / JCM 10339 / NBRC 14399) TaxID=479435 RepID=D2PYG2_KRIFD|nr:hypothetical protein [Kribbella flavida]ADB35530.1 hypothetical protein Kfla_6533 [Kribbella flavida DSM 17836]